MGDWSELVDGMMDDGWGGGGEYNTRVGSKVVLVFWFFGFFFSFGT